jgi:hypothetical protein
MKDTNIALLAIVAYFGLQWWKKRKEAEAAPPTELVAVDMVAAPSASTGVPAPPISSIPAVEAARQEAAAVEAAMEKALALPVPGPGASAYDILRKYEPGLAWSNWASCWGLGAAYWQGWLASRITTWKGAAAIAGIDPALATNYRTLAAELERIKIESKKLYDLYLQWQKTPEFAAQSKKCMYEVMAQFGGRVVSAPYGKCLESGFQIYKALHGF